MLLNKNKKLPDNVSSSIRIINEYKKFFPLNIEKVIRELLGHIPAKHTIGLSEIIVKDIFYKDYENCNGLYYAKTKKGRPAKIELAIETIYWPRPFVYALIPFVRKYLIANTLYHEIGHHRMRMDHGIPKKEKENYADNYSKKYIVKAFFKTLYFLRQLKELILWPKKFMRKLFSQQKGSDDGQHKT
ncbi:MAG: hypothetical protein ACQ9MH_14290 [Nitrospinales bacterium]